MSFDTLTQLTLYETKTRYYFVGSSSLDNTFRVAKIDREEVTITNDPVIYTKSEVEEVLMMINNGNKSSGGLKRVGTQFAGIFGLITFLE
jgi:phosphatidylinositol 3,5-bisphosphate 5-phosphatase